MEDGMWMPEDIKRRQRSKAKLAQTPGEIEAHAVVRDRV